MVDEVFIVLVWLWEWCCFLFFFDVVHKIASHPPTEGSASVFCQSLAPSPTRAIR